MKRPLTLNLSACLAAVLLVGATPDTVPAQGEPPPDHLAITVRGQTYCACKVEAEISEAMVCANVAEQSARQP